MANLASTYWNQGRWKKTEELEVEVMETRKAVLGQEHPDTLASMANLAYTWKSQGRVAEAITVLTQAVKTFADLSGNDHPYYRAWMTTLETWEGEIPGGVWVGPRSAVSRLSRDWVSVHRVKSWIRKKWDAF